MSRRKKRRVKKTGIIFIIVLILVLMLGGYYFYKIKQDKIELSNRERLVKEIKEHYNEYVVTNKDTDIYVIDSDRYRKVGMIGKNQELQLEDKEITYLDKYLEIISMDSEYYINYQDIDKIDGLRETNNKDIRYKNYIPFNENIVTNKVVSLYDKDDNLVYQFDKVIDSSIIVKKSDRYGIIYNDRLLYVKFEDVDKVVENKNTDLVNTTGIAVLNYHFFYDESVASEKKDCGQSICLSTNKLKTHLDYIKNNKIFTPTLEELEMYIDGEIQLPKSIVLTIDDGWRADIGSKIMNEYGINATVFLTSAHYNPEPYMGEYIEIHSHGHDIHNPGVCPGGQGGAIKCMDKSKLLDDLKASRDKLFNTRYFCYPFYEYNNYSIEVLKEAGFTMGFGGYGEGGNYRVKPGINKFKLPRYVVYEWTSASNIASYIG